MTTSSRSALTLLETVIAMAVFALLMTMVTQSVTMGTQMQTSVTTHSDLTDRADRVLHKIAGHLRSADYNWIYLNEGPISTYTFNICTGLTATGPAFEQQYVLTYDSIQGTLQGLLIETASGKVIKEDVAIDVRRGDGFQVNQLGTDVLVKGNQLQLTVALQRALPDQTVVTKEATTTVFLRSTIYANTNLTTTVTEQVITPPEEPVDPDAEPVDPDAPAADKPLVALGEDTDATNSKVKVNGEWVYPNHFIILGKVSMPSDSTDAIGSYTVNVDKPSDGKEADYVFTKGPKTTGNPKLADGEFTLTGWVQGSMTVTVEATSANGGVQTVTKTY